MKYFSTVIKFFLFIFCISATSIHLSATENHTFEKTLPLADYFTQTWNTHDGLPHNGVNAISQTTDGYLWIATWEGLARFNGREFKVFTRGSKIGLPDSSVKSLTSTTEGKLLVAGARGGLSERYNNEWTSGSLASTMINHAIYDKDDNIWLALEGKGVIYRNKNSQQDMVIINNIRAYKLVEDKEGTIWVATNKGLFSVKNKTIVRSFDKEYGLPNSPIEDLILTHDNILIVGTKQGAYKKVDGMFELLHPQLANERISSLLQDNANNIWLGTDNHGIFRLHKNKLEQLNDQSGLPNNRISALYQDKEQSIWVGTSSGLFRLREAPFITLTTKQGLSGNYIRAVLSHSDGSIWVGNSKGLNKIVNNNVTSIEVTNSHKNLSVLSLAETPKQQVLVGTYNQGVFTTTSNGLEKLFTVEDGLPSNEVRSILVDSANNLWVGTASGLAKISPDNTLEIFNKQSGLPASFIMTLAEDEFGKVWIGTGDGIASYNKGAIQTYRLNDKFDAEYAFGFYIEKNTLWMATDRGLININLTTNEMKAINKENGLPVDKIFQIVIDDINMFWLTSNRGIISITREEIDNVIQGKSKTVDFKLFSEGVGLLSSQANGGSTPAATLHKDGSIWVATSKGVSNINHERLKRSAEKIIPVVIEQFEADGKSYPMQSTVILPKGASRITIHYVGLGYLMSKHIEYQTQLVGFDKAWQNKNNKTFIEFTNLEPGDYTFKMRAKYPSGQWQENLATINFTVTPLYWQTTSFRLFIIILICFALYMLYRYRIITIKRSQVQLTKLIAQQTLEIQKQAELFSYQANHDQLTGLFNRRAFDEWCNNDFEKAKLKQQPLTVAILDIDHFKNVNDEYSHLIGDQVIKKIADILQDVIQSSITQVKLARWGGEEFTLLINSDVEKSYDFCDLLRVSIKNYDFSSIADNLKITISVGLTDNNEVIEYDKMLNHADQALYFAKHNGRNQVRIYQREDSDNNKKVNKRITKVIRAKSRGSDS
ncbi:ligand-binding sensor domain-containing protein [Colwellia sp. 20A7]|uniref:ligand-binding sensor domain-containing protein n=1 Tax=Colwellia sp. 20A7 TaxID=2689569 RepID=UPI00135A35A6|nr:two-component regulator propeller domain-containing protein [Colwellia sp. 20A7]